MQSEKNNKKILFIIPYPLGSAPGQRFRFEQYLSILTEKKYQYEVSSFLNQSTNQILYKEGFLFKKILGVGKGVLNRLILILSVPKYNYIFIFREAAPIGPPFFEWIIAQILRKKMIYDFDDAIWLPNTSEENKTVSKLKWHHKVRSICKWSYKISCGNEYLRAYSKVYNAKSVYNPTTIDTENLHNPIKYSQLKSKGDEITIGWTGTHSTLPYLQEIVPVIRELEKLYKFKFLVIADRNPKLSLRSFEFKQWNIKSEMLDLLSFDIGIMPLSEDRWSKGKCGFKILQYMALRIPAVASPVGVNNQIIDHGINGFLCGTQDDWYNKIEALILNPNLRIELGKNGREKVIKNYSVLSNTENFLSLFE